MTELVSQRCEACRRDAPHATEAEIAAYLPRRGLPVGAYHNGYTRTSSQNAA
jgi:hypothetical protein